MLVVQLVERPSQPDEVFGIEGIQGPVDLELLQGPARPVPPEIGVGQSRAQARIGGRLGQVVIEVGLAFLQPVPVEEEPAFRGDEAVGIGQVALAGQDRFVPCQGLLFLFHDGIEPLDGLLGLLPLPEIRVDVVEPHRGREAFGFGLEDFAVIDFGLLGPVQVEVRVGHGLVHPPGDGLTGLPVDVELPQGVLHPVLLPEGGNVVPAGPEIAGILQEDRLDLGDGLVDEPPAELRHGPVELEGAKLIRTPRGAFPGNRKGLEACAVLLQEGRLDGIQRRRGELPRLLRLQPRRVGAGAVAQPHLRVDDALEGLLVRPVVGQAEPVQLERLRVFPQFVVGLGHVAGKVADLPEFRPAGGVELHGLLVHPRPDQAQGVVGLEMPVAGQCLQGLLQKGERLAVAALTDPFQGLPVVFPRLDRRVRRDGGFRGSGRNGKRQDCKNEGYNKGC